MTWLQPSTTAASAASETSVAPIAPEVSTEQDEDMEGVLKMPSEIAFVPLSERASAPDEDHGDIVMVGRARRKKRKHGARSDQTQEATEDADTIDETPAIEPFDYSTAPNILDEGGEQDSRQPEGKQKKKKHKHKGMIWKQYQGYCRVYELMTGYCQVMQLDRHTMGTSRHLRVHGLSQSRGMCQRHFADLKLAVV